MKLLILKCSNNRHRNIIKHFRQVAEEQQAASMIEEEEPYQTRAAKRRKKQADFVLQPWQNKCTDDYVFIAYEGTKQHIILGWMQVSLQKFSYFRVKPLLIAHVDYISTNQNRAGEGIGKKMMLAMEGVMEKEDCDFIELMPLPGVIGFYTKLGYALEFVKVNYYTKWLKDTREESGRILEVYYEQLKIKDQQLSEEMEADEEEAFKPIYAKFTKEEKEKYDAMQDADESLRIAMIITYEESDIEEVRKMLYE
jgi:ribosomal protein S18 acetylase RimI-like enzyme